VINESEKTTLEKHLIENGTAVTLTVGDTVIPATLNNSKVAQDLISRTSLLP
jgi:chaperonin cofactor prefoldin